MLYIHMNTSKGLLILIHVFVLLPQLQQLLKHLHPLRLQVAGIHQLLVVLPPRAKVAFLRDELGGFAVVGFQEVNGFLSFGMPEFVLGHGCYFELTLSPYFLLSCRYGYDVIDVCISCPFAHFYVRNSNKDIAH